MESLLKATRLVGVLVTTLGGAHNTGMVWNDERTSVSHRWGRSPPLLEIVPAQVAIAREDGGAWTVYPLDPTGRRREPVETQSGSEGLRFRADPAHETVWYEAVRERCAPDPPITRRSAGF